MSFRDKHIHITTCNKKNCYVQCNNQHTNHTHIYCPVQYIVDDKFLFDYMCSVVISSLNSAKATEIENLTSDL